MHATQHPGDACPEPTHTTAAATTDAAAELVGLLTDDTRFRAWIAQATATVSPPAVPDPADRDGLVVTDAGRQTLDDPALPVSLGEQPHPAAFCRDGGLPHRGPCVEPGLDAAPGTAGLVLRLAALYLHRHGWVQGVYYDPTASVFTPTADLVGAIAMVCYGGPVEAPAQHFDDPGFLDFEEAVLHLDRYLLVMDGSQAYEFNDANGRTAADVIRVLPQAAAVPAEELIDALRLVHADDARRAHLFGGDAG